jgi:MIP family channel proteins
MSATVASNAHWLFHPMNVRWSGRQLKVPFFNIHLQEEVRYGGITLKITEDYNTTKFKQACVAEFISMMFFVVICCGCAMVTLNLPNPNLMMVAASFGFGIMCLAQFVGPLSGGHINCAVSWGLFIAGRVSLVRAFCYTLSQMAGSILGAFFLWGIFGSNWPAARAFGSNSWDETIFTGGQVFLAEMMGTMILLYNVFATIDSPTAGGGRLGNYPIAMSVMVAHLFLIPIDGCSINPTRSFGPSLVAGFAGIGGPYMHQQYMFWFAPLIGATITAIIYEYAPLKQKKREGKGNMQDDLYLAKVKRGELDDVELDDEEPSGSSTTRHETDE